MNTRLRHKAAFLASASALVVAALAPTAFAQQGQQTSEGASPAAATTGPDQAVTVNQVVVTGSTSKRTLLNASVAVTAVNQAELDRRAPRGTDDVLELIPGFYVEATAGPVSNNYSVRGLPGGGQEFVRLEEDGLPIIYGGLNDDEVFQYDLSIDRVEGLEGGTSGILTPNAAGASVNFISRPLNFDQAGGLARVTGASYGEERGDFWYSAPIPLLGNNVAGAISGFIDSTPGVRDSPFTYKSYHFKAQLEKRFDSGGYVRATYKRWDEHDPYYADQPYAVTNGQIGSVPGLDGQHGNIIGSSFGRITMPDSCAGGECTRTFSELNGIHATGNEFRIDVEKPINDSLSVFARVRYTQTDWDFNGVFAGSGSGNAGLAPAAQYLTYTPDTTSACANTVDHPHETLTWAGSPAGSPSPIGCLLVGGQQAFGTTLFGIKNLRTGQVIAGTNTAALNALNGNGLLQQTWLNQQLTKIRDWGSDFGVKWNARGDVWANNLTLGGMVYSNSNHTDQSAVSVVLNDVKNGSDIYDLVALDPSNNQVIGDLTNNGMTRYGDWGNGMTTQETDSYSVYFNDELTLFDRLHIDFGMRHEDASDRRGGGNQVIAPVPAGTAGIITANLSGFDGTYSYSSAHQHPTDWTIGANYEIMKNLSVYARYADGYEITLNGGKPTELKLYEAGVTYAGHGFLGTLRGFRTEFDRNGWPAGAYALNPNESVSLFGNSITNGFDLDATYRPTFEQLHAFSVHAQLTWQDSALSGITAGVTDNLTGKQITDPSVISQAASFYDGHKTQHTPQLIYAITPQYDLPDHRGNIYLRYYYTGQVYADAGNNLALPGFGVLSIGGAYDITRRLNLNLSVQNVNDTVGLTEGNPRQGPTQSVVNGFFYGRGIVGTNALAQLTFKF